MTVVVAWQQTSAETVAFDSVAAGLARPSFVSFLDVAFETHLAFFSPRLGAARAVSTLQLSISEPYHNLDCATVSTPLFLVTFRLGCAFPTSSTS